MENIWGAGVWVVPGQPKILKNREGTSRLIIFREKGEDMLRKFLTSLCASAAFAVAGSPVIKVDFDVSGRSTSEVSEPNYVPWVVTGVSSADTTLSGVKITVAKGSAGSALKSTWYKAGVQSPNYARLVGDGIQVADGNSGGEISLTFSGLSDGTHSLLAYLNNVDAPTAYTYSDVAVYANGNKVTTVTPSNRALSTAEAATAYVTFTVSNGSATVKFSPVTSSATYRNVTLNGFALNVSNSAAQAKSPSPSDLDDHAAHDGGSLTLSWTAASGAKKHRVYLGTDSLSVLKATTGSAEYKGEQTAASYKMTGAYALNLYYWRIDEVDASGTVTTGDVWRFRIGRDAFRGAEGYGRSAVGGRGGKVVYVTNLDDDGEGSLREACTADIGPRTILFKVSGLVELKSRLVCNNDYTTIAGQSAPGKGITIKSAPIGFTGNDMVVRFLRVRLGYGTTYDGMGLTGGDHSILDHASISWTIDEAFSSRGAKNITLQRTLISEALNIADHQNYSSGTGHGYAATIGGDVGSFHHNLLANNAGRNWSLGGGLDGNGYYAGRLDIFNNVVYNWYSRVTDGGAHEVNFVGNYYKRGAASLTSMDYVLSADLEGTGLGTQSYYFHNNVLQKTDGSFLCNGTNDECGRRYTTSNGQVVNWTVFQSEPFFASYATVQSASAAYKDVLSDVGQRMPILDNHDRRVINEAKNGTYSYKGSVGGLAGIPDRETDVTDTANVKGWEPYPSVSWADGYDSDMDGLPDFWEEMYGYDAHSKSGDFSDANADRLGDGWTELERYLDWMARPHYTFEAGETQVVDLSGFTAGYDGGTYKLTDVPGGVNASLSGSKMTVSLDSDFGGVGFITFTLTDKSGDTFSREIGVTQNLPAKVSQSQSSSSQAQSSSSSAASGVAAGGVYQAEDGTMSNAVFEDKNSGYNGTGYVNFAGDGESSVSIPVTVGAAGEYAVTLTYAHGKADVRHLTVTTSESAAQTLSFGSTGSWSTWDSVTVTVILPAGESVIVIATDGADGPNLDQISLRSLSTTGLPRFATGDFEMSVHDGVVSLSNLPLRAEIVVTDLSGKHLMARKTVVAAGGVATVSLKNFGAGVYVVRVRGGGSVGTFKVRR